MIYIVYFDFTEPRWGRDVLINRIKESDAWARLGGGAYLVKSNKTAKELRDYYRTGLDNVNDKIYVGEVKAPAAWYGMPKDVSDWIVNNVK